MKTIMFAASNSSSSINHQLIRYTASLVPHSKVLQLTDYNLPLYSEDIEKAIGIPQLVKDLDAILAEASQFIISIGEHNGNLSAFFKNILDWLSRNNRNFLAHKKVILLSTSPGAGGAKSALAIMEKTIPYFGAEIVNTFSIGEFYKVFKDGKLIDKELAHQLKKQIESFC